MDYDFSWREATFLLPFQSSLESRYLKNTDKTDFRSRSSLKHSMVTKVLSKCLFNLCLVPNGGAGILSPWSSIQSSLTKGHNFLTRGKQEKLLLPACQGTAKLAIYVLSQNDANFF